ncbi:MAG: sulfur carrier protein ThiS adenylyltransferase ThiF [Candidatus Margulisbacteria bacterium]|nr:sulfur carrier protein ThiS adenylyltransferase ThiF [Candidatus Margulisiibacteriota bacterium]
MNAFEKALENYFGADNLKKIQAVKIGIAGLGGLGSNCAFNLVRSGFRKLVLCDYDVIEPSNLNRQFYFNDQLGMPKVEALKTNLLRINSNLELEMNEIKLDNENIGNIFSSCSIVVEALDKAEHKKIMAEEFGKSGKLFVSASGLAGWGKSDEIKCRQISASFYLIGDGKTEASSQKPPCSPRVNIAAAKQADMILEWVLSQ